MKSIINSFLQRLGYQLVSRQSLEFFKEGLAAAGSLQARHEKASTEYSAIIFSFDRCLQLEALLHSMLLNFVSMPDIHILYRASNAEHKAAYQELEKDPRFHAIHFHEEQSFRIDLLALLEQLHKQGQGRLFFLVDDIIFTHQVDLSRLSQFAPEEFIVSLRLGSNIDYSYTRQLKEQQPVFFGSPDEEFIQWQWQGAAIDWGYPLSVDGHIFSLAELIAFLELVEFKAPNSLEANLQRVNAYFSQKKGLAYKQSRLVNNPCNKVQTENDNLAGEVSADALLQQWQAGYRIDITDVQGFANNSCHQEFEYKLRPAT